LKKLSLFFDFIFYKSYRFYLNQGEEHIPGVYAISIITLFPLLNISSLIFIAIDIFNIKYWNYEKYFLLLIFLCFFLFNYQRIYKRKRELLLFWDRAELSTKKSFTRYMWFYIIISIFFLFLGILYK